MTTQLERTLDTDAPLQQIYARWGHVILYADIMPSLRQVQPLDHGRWRWTRADGDWTIGQVRHRPRELVSWQATRDSDGTECLATVLFIPKAGGQRTLVVYTLTFPRGVGQGIDLDALAAEMDTTLRRSAGILVSPVDEAAAQAQAMAANPQDAQAEVLHQVIDSGEALQATLAQAANDWARAMTASIRHLSTAMSLLPLPAKAIKVSKTPKAEPQQA